MSDHLREQIIEDLRRVERQIGHAPSRNEYRAGLGAFSERAIRNVFGTFSKALIAAGYHPGGYDRVRDPAEFINLVKPKHLSRPQPAVSAERIAGEIEGCARTMEKEPCDLTWLDFRDYIAFAYGQNNAGITPRDITRLGGFNQIRDAFFAPTGTNQRVERARILEHAGLNRRLGTWEARQRWFLEEFEQTSKRIFEGRIEPVAARVQETDPEYELSAVFSDDHIGSDIRRAETGAIEFGIREEARRFASIIRQILEYRPQANHRTKLNLFVLGDVIEGLLHTPFDGAEQSEQECRAIHLFVQGISILAMAFHSVEVDFEPGNHGRITIRHPGRATSGKYDSRETVIYFAVKYALSRFKNIRCRMPISPYGTKEILGKKVLYTHGDTVINAGSPGKRVEVERLENVLNRINASLPDLQEYAMVVIGHVHVPLQMTLGNGSILLINGALVPVNPFSISLGLFESPTGHWLFESTRDRIVLNSRFLTVDRSTDRDESLDAIIQPWVGFDEDPPGRG